MLTGLATECHLKLSEGAAELVLARPHKLCALLPVQHEVELGDGLDLEGLARLSISVRLHCTEHNVLVLVSATSAFIGRLEAHARPATWRPEIDDYAMIRPDDCLKLHQRSNVANLAELGRRGGYLGWGLLSLAIVASLAVLLHLLHHLLHGRVILHHLLHRWIVLHHLLESGGHLPLAWLLFIATWLPNSEWKCLLVIVE